jgi:hypothetical protein
LIDDYRLFHRRMRKLLRIAGILIGGAAKALSNWNKVSEAQRVPIKQNLPRITSGWDYRPKETNRRLANVQGPGMETADLLTPSVAEDKSDKATFDDRWLEFGIHTFVNVDGVDPAAANEPMKPTLSDQEGTVSAYDQSPIDERTALRHDGRYSRPIT